MAATGRTKGDATPPGSGRGDARPSGPRRAVPRGETPPWSAGRARVPQGTRAPSPGAQCYRAPPALHSLILREQRMKAPPQRHTLCPGPITHACCRVSQPGESPVEIPGFYQHQGPIRRLKAQEKCDFADTPPNSCDNMPPNAQKGGNCKGKQLVTRNARVLNFRHNNSSGAGVSGRLMVAVAFSELSRRSVTSAWS